jgi:hypothetical protein
MILMSLMLSVLKDQEAVGGDIECQTAPKGVAGAAERMLMLKVDSVAVQFGWDDPAPARVKEARHTSLLP